VGREGLAGFRKGNVVGREGLAAGREGAEGFRKADDVGKENKVCGFVVPTC